MGGIARLEDLISVSPHSIQIFDLAGRTLSRPSSIPQFCQTLSRTQWGARVCNNGCGIQFPLATISSDRICFFSCPFGMTNACAPVGDTSCGAVLLGGRFFQNYQQLRLCMENSLTMGVSLDEALEACSAVRFHDISELEDFFRGMTRALAPAISEPIIGAMVQGATDAPAFHTDGRDASHRLEFMRQFQDVLRHAENLTALGDMFLQEVVACSEVQTASLFVLDDERDELVLTSSRGLPPDIEPGARRPAHSGVMGHALETQQPVVVNGAGISSAYPRTGRQHYRSDLFISLPLCIDRSALGVLNLTNRKNNQGFAADEVNWLSMLSYCAAESIEHQKMSEQLEKTQHLSLIDLDVHVGSRRFFNMRLKEEFQRGARGNHPLSLALVRIGFGPAGRKASSERRQKDEAALLRQAAATLSASLRAFDMVMRYHGNIFALILPETHRSEAKHIMERMQESLQEVLRSGATDQSGVPEAVEIAFGLAEYPGDVSTIADLKSRAEQELLSGAPVSESSCSEENLSEGETDKGDDPTAVLEDLL